MKRGAGATKLLWLAMGVVIVAALAIGTFDQPKPSDAERAHNLAETIRCPSCRSQSAASSDTPSSQAVRELIRKGIAAGDSDEEIRDYVASRYSRAILLDPSGSGFSALVWALPAAVVVIAIAGLAFRFRDWRPGSVTATDADRSIVAEALAGASNPGPESGSRTDQS